MKTKSSLFRLTDDEHFLFSAKSKILGINKSKLFRNGAFKYWNDGEPDAGMLLKLYQDGSDKDKRVVVDLLFEYYRLKGYPHHKLSASELRQGMRTLAVTKNPLLDNDHLQSNTTGIAIANHFHPHMVKVRCLTNYRSPYEQFADDDLLRDSINRWMELDNEVTPSGLRRILRTRDGVRSVVNFKPAISLFLYNTYAPQDGVVLDVCAGYGGRLCGAIAANKGILYHGIDPDGNTAVGNMQMASFYSGLYNNNIESSRSWKFGFKFDLGCAEDIMLGLPDESYDLTCSSPPFFSVEKYSSVLTQSYLRYPVYNVWKENFLFVLIKESFRVCKKGGHLILNLKDYKKYPIASDACKCAESLGFRLVTTYQQRMSNSEYNRIKGKPMYHTEPIFVWIK